MSGVIPVKHEKACDTNRRPTTGLVSIKEHNFYTCENKCRATEFEYYVRGATTFNKTRVNSGIAYKFINEFNNNALNKFIVTLPGPSDQELEFKGELIKPGIFNLLNYGEIYITINLDKSVTFHKPHDVSYSDGVYTLTNNDVTEYRTKNGHVLSDEYEYQLNIPGIYHIKYRCQLYPRILELIKLYDETLTEINREMHKASTKLITTGEVERLNADQYAKVDGSIALEATPLIAPIPNAFKAEEYKKVLDKIEHDISRILNLTGDMDTAYATATAVLDRDTNFEAMINDINDFVFVTLKPYLLDWYKYSMGMNVEITKRPFEKNNMLIKATILQQMSNVIPIKDIVRQLNPYKTDDEILLSTAMLKFEQGKELFNDERDILVKYGKISDR
jgi:hypothetical protein